jgi:hypothetical protein
LASGKYLMMSEKSNKSGQKHIFGQQETLQIVLDTIQAVF